MTKPYYVLGIETSCDETALAILEYHSDTSATVLAEQVSSQHEVHKLYGGVVPELASREHVRALPLLYKHVFTEANLRLDDIDLVGVTTGPGLKGCLLTGTNFAKGLVIGRKLPLVGVNHIEGHVLAPMLDNHDLEFPFLALVVSGGHSEIHEVHGVRDYRLITRTIDDAAGEAFDKSAHLLGFSYPGGAKLAKIADQAKKTRSFELPKVMRQSTGLSFSGLKTAISLLVEKHKEELKEDGELLADIAAAIQESIVDALCYKLKKAIDSSGIKAVAVTGGVSANKHLRTRVAQLAEKTFFPSMLHCMDNAAMIAYVAGVRYRGFQEQDFVLKVTPRAPIETSTNQPV